MNDSNIVFASVKINVKQIALFLKHVFTANRGGHGIHSPFVYKLCENVFNEKVSFYRFKELHELRKDLQIDQTVIEVNDLGAGSRSISSNKRQVKDIVKKGNSSRRQSELLFKLINYLHCNTIIELGTSLGLNTSYLARANSKARVFTIEGCSGLCAFAEKLKQKQHLENVTIINRNFNDGFPELLQSLGTFDFLYIDGNHRYKPTVNYFAEAIKHKKACSVIVLDDICWSDEMVKAWNEIKSHPEVTISIDCFYFGIVFFRKEQKQKEHFKIFF